MSEREPILMSVTGQKGVGKTYTTKQTIDDYVKDNPKTGKKGRKVLIYDINMEYTDYKVLDVKDVGKFARQKKVEVRRVLPVWEGKTAELDEMVEILHLIVRSYRGGMLILEDINKYLIQAKSPKIIGLLATNRHRDLDIICHFQSLSALDPRMWQNTSFVRFHSQIDDISRYKNRIPNFEMFKIAQCLVDYRYLKVKDKRFYCFVACEDNYIAGDFTKRDFRKACMEYLEQNPKRVNNRVKRFGKGGEARQKAVEHLYNELETKYYKGI